MTTILPKKIRKMLDQKVNQWQNTISLEQQIYASLENFTPTLLVMFRHLEGLPVITKKKKLLPG